jgi:hypothetical protein
MLLRKFSGMWARITGQSEAEILVTLGEVDPKNAMESGLILPSLVRNRSGSTRTATTQPNWEHWLHLG